MSHSRTLQQDTQLLPGLIWCFGGGTATNHWASHLQVMASSDLRVISQITPGCTLRLQ